MRFITPLANYANMLLHDNLQIEPTTRCNLSCLTCPHKVGVPIIDIPMWTFSKILLNHKSIRQINLQGLGEPFMHPRFDEICQLAGCYGTNIRTFTNGTITNKNAMPYLNGITVSLDTLNPVIARRIKGASYDLKTVLDNILYYNSLIPTAVNFTRSHLNYTDMPTVLDWCEAAGVEFNMTRVQNWYAPDEPEWEQSHADVLEERRLFGQMPRERFLCQWRNLRWYYYRADGVRNPCCRRLGYKTYGAGCCDTCPD